MCSGLVNGAKLEAHHALEFKGREWYSIKPEGSSEHYVDQTTNNIRGSGDKPTQH